MAGIGIGACNGWLRLQWTWAGKRQVIYLGLTDTRANRQIAELRAKQIETDMVLGAFDPSLVKYKPKVESGPTLVGMFAEFIEYKKKRVDNSTLEKYRATLQGVKDFFAARLISAIVESNAEQFAEWLLRDRNNSARTVKEKITLLKACWKWAVKIKKWAVSANPWENVEIAPIARQLGKELTSIQPNPFTSEEVARILEAFRSHPIYYYYADYVLFLFATGSRIGEAIGLRWGSISEDCSLACIKESLSNDERKPTKTGKIRSFRLSVQSKKMLLLRRPENPGYDSFVFLSPKGHPLDRRNFRNRAWEPILEKLEIDYRKPYATRATFASHALEQGMSPASVAQLTGHSTRTLYEHYLGSVVKQPQLPELF